MRTSAVLIALLLGATAVQAQPPTPAPPPGMRLAEPTTPERTAAARAEADALLAAADAAELFENVTDDASPTLRHTRSGLVCSFNSGSALNRVLIFPPGLPRGDDIGCNTEGEGTHTTLYATRYGEPTTLDEQLEGAVRSLRVRFPDAEPVEVQLQMNTGEVGELPEHRSASFLATTPEGRRLHTRIAVAILGEWVIKQRTSAPAEAGISADMMSEMMFVSTLREMSGGAAAAPPSAPRPQ